ncbi:MAG: maleylacetoacetate isomerase, partial [Pseudomonadota bacterium]
MTDRVLYDYWRSTAAYRVRIVLHMKGLAHDHKTVDLRTGAQ